MKFNILKLFVVTLLVFLVTACCGPGKWAEIADSELRCNMSISDIENVANTKTLSLGGRKFGWATHMIKDGSSNIYLGLENNQLKWMRVHWDIGLERSAMYQKVDLCGTTSDPDSISKLRQAPSSKGQ
jgi:hypothetical protein